MIGETTASLDILLATQFSRTLVLGRSPLDLDTADGLQFTSTLMLQVTIVSPVISPRPQLIVGLHLTPRLRTTLGLQVIRLLVIRNLRKIRVNPDMASGLQLILRLQLILVLEFPQTLTLGETTVNLDTIVGFHFARNLVISRGHL